MNNHKLISITLIAAFLAADTSGFSNFAPFGQPFKNPKPSLARPIAANDSAVRAELRQYAGLPPLTGFSDHRAIIRRVTNIPRSELRNEAPEIVHIQLKEGDPEPQLRKIKLPEAGDFTLRITPGSKTQLKELQDLELEPENWDFKSVNAKLKDLFRHGRVERVERSQNGNDRITIYFKEPQSFGRDITLNEIILVPEGSHFTDKDSKLLALVSGNGSLASVQDGAFDHIPGRVFILNRPFLVQSRDTIEYLGWPGDRVLMEEQYQMALADIEAKKVETAKRAVLEANKRADEDSRAEAAQKAAALERARVKPPSHSLNNGESAIPEFDVSSPALLKQLSNGNSAVGYDVDFEKPSLNEIEVVAGLFKKMVRQIRQQFRQRFRGPLKLNASDRQEITDSNLADLQTKLMEKGLMPLIVNGWLYRLFQDRVEIYGVNKGLFAVSYDEGLRDWLRLDQRKLLIKFFEYSSAYQARLYKQQKPGERKKPDDVIYQLFNEIFDAFQRDKNKLADPPNRWGFMPANVSNSLFIALGTQYLSGTNRPITELPNRPRLDEIADLRARIEASHPASSGSVSKTDRPDVSIGVFDSAEDALRGIREDVLRKTEKVTTVTLSAMTHFEYLNRHLNSSHIVQVGSTHDWKEADKYKPLTDALRIVLHSVVQIRLHEGGSMALLHPIPVVGQARFQVIKQTLRQLPEHQMAASAGNFDLQTLIDQEWQTVYTLVYLGSDDEIKRSELRKERDWTEGEIIEELKEHFPGWQERGYQTFAHELAQHFNKMYLTAALISLGLPDSFASFESGLDARDREYFDEYYKNGSDPSVLDVALHIGFRTNLLAKLESHAIQLAKSLSDSGIKKLFGNEKLRSYFHVVDFDDSPLSIHLEVAKGALEALSERLEIKGVIYRGDWYAFGDEEMNNLDLMSGDQFAVLYTAESSRAGEERRKEYLKRAEKPANGAKKPPPKPATKNPVNVSRNGDQNAPRELSNGAGHAPRQVQLQFLPEDGTTVDITPEFAIARPGGKILIRLHKSNEPQGPYKLIRLDVTTVSKNKNQVRLRLHSNGESGERIRDRSLTLYHLNQDGATSPAQADFAPLTQNHTLIVHYAPTDKTILVTYLRHDDGHFYFAIQSGTYHTWFQYFAGSKTDGVRQPTRNLKSELRSIPAESTTASASRASRASSELRSEEEKAGKFNSEAIQVLLRLGIPEPLTRDQEFLGQLDAILADQKSQNQQKKAVETHLKKYGVPNASTIAYSIAKTQSLAVRIFKRPLNLDYPPRITEAELAEYPATAMKKILDLARLGVEINMLLHYGSKALSYFQQVLEQLNNSSDVSNRDAILREFRMKFAQFTEFMKQEERKKAVMTSEAHQVRRFSEALRTYLNREENFLLNSNAEETQVHLQQLIIFMQSLDWQLVYEECRKRLIEIEEVISETANSNRWMDRFQQRYLHGWRKENLKSFRDALHYFDKLAKNHFNLSILQEAFRLMYWSALSPALFGSKAYEIRLLELDGEIEKSLDGMSTNFNTLIHALFEAEIIQQLLVAQRTRSLNQVSEPEKEMMMEEAGRLFKEWILRDERKALLGRLKFDVTRIENLFDRVAEEAPSFIDQTAKEGELKKLLDQKSEWFDSNLHNFIEDKFPPLRELVEEIGVLTQAAEVMLDPEVAEQARALLDQYLGRFDQAEEKLKKEVIEHQLRDFALANNARLLHEFEFAKNILNHPGRNRDYPHLALLRSVGESLFTDDSGKKITEFPYINRARLSQIPGLNGLTDRFFEQLTQLHHLVDVYENLGGAEKDLIKTYLYPFDSYTHFILTEIPKILKNGNGSSSATVPSSTAIAVEKRSELRVSGVLDEGVASDLQRSFKDVGIALERTNARSELRRAIVGDQVSGDGSIGLIISHDLAFGKGKNLLPLIANTLAKSELRIAIITTLNAERQTVQLLNERLPRKMLMASSVREGAARLRTAGIQRTVYVTGESLEAEAQSRWVNEVTLLDQDAIEGWENGYPSVIAGLALFEAVQEHLTSSA